ncbi:uncharacterized protein [Maniola hyperantus]|uniref:uncharacterized protein isoform X1 n=2 Tax=Aphantopus hyperantus TaxID=2795564 RepID=UPI001567DB40|nr:uncharacterized protein LOC117985573 [Maniola hyperantus]
MFSCILIPRSTVKLKLPKMSYYNKYIPISEERYNALNARYEEFLKVVDSKTVDPIKVFEPLSPKQIEEIMLIREVSKELQRKKEEDMKKMKAAETAEVEIKENNINGTAENLAIKV